MEWGFDAADFISAAKKHLPPKPQESIIQCSARKIYTSFVDDEFKKKRKMHPKIGGSPKVNTK